MKKRFALLTIALMVSTGLLLILDEDAEGEKTDLLFDNQGTAVDGGTIELTEGGGTDTSYYFRIGKNVPISSAHLNISTHNSHLGQSIQDPYVDVGVDGNKEWSFDDEGYGKFGEQRYFSDDSEKVSINMPSGGGYNTKNSILIPKNSEIASAKMDVQGRFVPERINEQQVMVDPSKDAISPRVMKHGDIDGDGDLDVVMSDIQHNKIVWLENPGNTSEDWIEHTVTSSYYVTNSYGLDLGDIDGDGDLDIACSSYTRGYVMYIRNNNGGSSWSMYRFKTGFRYAGTVKLADMDQDGDLDVVCAAWYTYYHTSDEFLYWFEAPSNPNTTSWSGHKISNSPYYYMYTYFGMDVGDINGDDYPDVIASTYPRYSYYGYNQLAYYKNPKSTSGSWSKTVIDSSAQRIFCVEIADMDNDNDNDVIAASYDGNRIKYYNQTSSGWSENNIKTLSNARYVQVIDFNDDGYNDTVYAGGSGIYDFGVLEQNGKTSSWTSTTITDQVIVPQAFSAFDMDGDDDHDFMLAGASSSQLVQIITKDVSEKEFENTWIYEGGIKDIRDMDYMDMDGDGDLDMVFISYETGYVGWWENDGSPLDGAGPLHQLGVLGNGIKLMLADVDGDEDKDIVAINSGGTAKWFENDNDPFSLWDNYQISSSIPTPKGFYAGDFTGDGKADMAVSSDRGYSNGYVRVYKCPSNPKQSSSWSYNQISGGVSYMSSIWADDIDLDGDLDVVVCYGAYGSGNALYYRNPLNQGGDPMAGQWAAKNIGGGMYYPEDIKTIDINDDGYPDVVVTGRYYYSKVRWFENPGTGGSWKGRVIYGSAYNWYLEVGDIGNDGYADIVFNRGSSSYPTAIIWLEEPDDLDGSWITHSVDSSHSGTHGLGIADLEGDGVAEILSCSTSQDEIRAYEIEAIYPSEFGLDVGADEAAPDRSIPGILKGKHHLEFKQALQETVDQPGGSVRKFKDNYGTEMLEIPLEIYSDTIGKLALDNIRITYNASVNITQNGEGKPLSEVLDRLIPDYTDDEAYTRIYIGVGGRSAGMANVSNFFVEFNAIPRRSRKLPEFSVDEDSKATVSDELYNYFRDDYTDPENLEIDIFLKGPQRNKIEASIINSRLVLDSTITENFYTRTSEPYDIMGYLTVTDDGGPNNVPSRTMRTADFPIFVNPVNDDPVRGDDDLPTLYAWEGRTTTVADLDDYDLFYDADGDSLVYHLEPDLDLEEYNESADFQIKRIKKNNTLEVSLNERSDWTGTVPVTLYATDKSNFNFNQNPRVQFQVVVLNINDAPVWMEIPDVTVTEDIEDDNVIELTQFAMDIDTPRSELEIMLVEYTNKSFIQLQTRRTDDNLVILSFRPKVENWFGSSLITLQLSDGEFTTTQEMMLHVDPVNDHPSISISEPSENSRVEPGTFSIVGEARDVEGLLSVEVNYRGEWLLARGTHSWGVTVTAEGTDKIQEGVPIQARCFDGEVYSYDHVNITIMPKIETKDLDYDNDGVENSRDAFPLDPSEWSDRDGDGYGDNEDAFPDDPEWHSDKDKDGIADVAEEEGYARDPENRPINNEMEPEDEGKEYNLAIPIILILIAVIVVVLAVLSSIAYLRKRNASRDPRKMASYYAKQQRSRERTHDLMEKLPLAQLSDKISSKIGGGEAEPSTSLPTPSRPGGPAPTMVRQPMNLPPRPGMQQMPQRQLPPRPPQQIKK